MTQWDFLTGDAEKDRRNVDILLDSVEALYGPQHLNELMTSAVDRAIQVSGAARGMLLLEGEGGEVAPAVARNSATEDLALDEQYSKSVVKRVWTSGEPALMLGGAEDPVDLGDSIHLLQLLSIMAVPMPVKGRSLGVLYVDSTAHVKEFTQSDFSVFKALGGLVAMAVENARLLAEKEEQDRLKRELLVAHDIQQRLLPKDLPQPAGFDLAGVFRPCEETSGDYYDVIPFGGERLALVMGDVSGHGLGAAMHMARVHALVHASLPTQPDPGDVIRSVNVFLEGNMDDNEFMTMFLGALDPESRTLQYVSAGHCPALWLRASGALEELGGTGMLMGFLPDASYRLTEPRELEPGSVVMLYTDGIYEARDAHGAMFSEERLRSSYVRHASAAQSAAEIIERVLADLHAFVGDQPLDDDLTCLVVRAV